MKDLASILQKHQHEFYPIVEFNPAKDRLVVMDFSATNTSMREDHISNTDWFSLHMEQTLKEAGAKFAMGGYDENRTIYKRSPLFDGKEERTLHLGIDIWGPAGTKVYAPLGGMVHSFANNKAFGDYGATIILQHQLDTFSFYTLYGHLALSDIATLRKGRFITRGECFAHFGEPKENGDWPPHLHFQVIIDMGIKEGDYAGVCKLSEKEKYLKNSPDPDLLLNLRKYVLQVNETP